jgi:hypothetical protein
MTWTPFELVDKATLSQKTNVGITTYNNWQKNRVRRLRYLEYSVYFDLLNATEKEHIMTDANLTLVQFLMSISPKDKKLTQAIIQDVSGESARTLRSWWGEQQHKRELCLTLILGVISLLLVSSQSKYSLYWQVTDKEKTYKDYVNTRFTSMIDDKAFAKWKAH